MKAIYLDYAATTPVDPRVAKEMAEYLTMDGAFGNPASMHEYGRVAREALETARAQVAAYLAADPSEIIWTSGATESNNLALKGAAHLYQRKGKHIVTMKTEHKSVLDVCQHLEKEGYTVTYLSPQSNGLLSLDEFTAALREDTILASIMHVNNETGVVQDLHAIAQITSARGILLHVDAAQSPGKINLNLSQTPIDLVSLCAHKVYGPKGIGALYLRKKPRVRVQPLIHGGGHEQGMRSGTLATHQIVGMGEAFKLAAQSMQQANMQQEVLEIKQLRELFLKKLSYIKNLYINSAISTTTTSVNSKVTNSSTNNIINSATNSATNTTSLQAVPHILNLRFDGMLADAILAELPMISASTASACQGKGTEGSYVLRAMGLSEQQAKSSIRFSFGRFTTLEDIHQAADAIMRLFK
jgi:cysteine desulfurase